jgi:hypothetical protein
MTSYSNADVDYLGDSVGFTITFSNRQQSFFDPSTVQVWFIDGAGQRQSEEFELSDLTRLEQGKYLLKYNVPSDGKEGTWTLTVHVEYTPENLKDTLKYYFKIEKP